MRSPPPPPATSRCATRDLGTLSCRMLRHRAGCCCRACRRLPLSGVAAISSAHVRSNFSGVRGLLPMLNGATPAQCCAKQLQRALLVWVGIMTRVLE